MGHWWSNTARCKLKYTGKNLPHLQFVRVKSNVELSGNRKVPLRWETVPLLVFSFIVQSVFYLNKKRVNLFFNLLFLSNDCFIKFIIVIEYGLEIFSSHKSAFYEISRYCII